MRKPLAIFTAAAFCLAVFPGCIHHEETVYREVTRKQIEFENDAAARIFYETLSSSSHRNDQPEHSTEINIPIVFKHKRRVVDGANVAFNNAVEECDTNRDRKITESEAKIYAEQEGE